MEPTRLDRIAIVLGRRGSRRVMFSALTKATAGTTLAALVTVPGRQEAAARCLPLFEVCTSTKQCCRHKRHRRICAANPQINDQENTCCIPEGKRCSFGGQCCGSGSCTAGRCKAIIISDRAVKTDVANVDGQAVLAQVAALPIRSWRYRTEEATVRHIGPMAQDFAAAFHVGDDERHIHAVDGQGVALAAIQGLIEQVAELRSQLALIRAPLSSSATNQLPSPSVLAICPK